MDCLIYLHEHGCPWHTEMFHVFLSNVGRFRNDTAVLSCMRYMLANGCPHSSDEVTVHLFPDERATCVRLVARSLLIPRMREMVRWMIKVRPYAWHWFEEHQRVLCAPGGKGRKRDIEAIGEAMEAVSQSRKL